MNHVLSAAFAALVILLSGCAGLPSLEGRQASTAFTDTAGTRLGRQVSADVAAHPDKTGLHALSDPLDAFAARLLLADAADKSIDAQYFVWADDKTGNLLLEALWQAAKRGVRVRLLLDDFHTAPLDPTIAALNGQPHIEVRLYNPFVHRNARILNIVGDFARLNRRMHNKSFTVDSQITIVGGRNIGNEYFGAGSGLAFADLDVIAIGPAAGAVAKQFDLYWNSAAAYPAKLLVAPWPEGAAYLEAKFAALHRDSDAADYLRAVQERPIVSQMLDHKLVFEWADARLLYDDPAKTAGVTTNDTLLFPDLMQAMGTAESSLDLVSPYFVPAQDGTAALTALARRGVKVRAVTNSLAATDVKVVHAGYEKRREELLGAGVALYEFTPSALDETYEYEAPWFGPGTASALHAKTLAADRRRVFVGSFNFDPRSQLLNTEMGLVIESPTLAGRLGATIDTVVPLVAYEVRLAPEGRGLQWVERTGSGERIYDVDPQTTWVLRLGINFLGLFPIESLL